jgi:hypothetical protein
LARIAEEHALGYMLERERDSDDLILDIPDMMAPYIQGAAILAADWYEDEDPESGFQAAVADEIALERLIATARWVFRGPQLPENRMRTAAHSLVFDAARNTVWANAEDEGVAVIRHELAGACDDCAVRATVDIRGRLSRSDDVSREFHHACTGLFGVVRREPYVPPDHALEWGRKIAGARASGVANPEDIAKFIAAH